MCCLRYEDQTYTELRKRLPNRKSLVETDDGWRIGHLNWSESEGENPAGAGED